MKLYLVCSIGFLFILTSCENQNENKIVPIPEIIKSNNDTTKILEAALKSIFEPIDLPGIEALRKPYRFKDSILFSSDTISLSLLPNHIDSLKFKILPSNQICSMIKMDSGKIQTPNYLYIGGFEKTDTGYNVVLASYGCLWFKSGGTFFVSVSKENDSFIVKHRMSGSLN